MPCFTPDQPPQSLEDMNEAGELTHGQLEAVLCGVFRAFGRQRVIETINWEQAGVKDEAVRCWWSKHQEKDQRR